MPRTLPAPVDGDVSAAASTAAAARPGDVSAASATSRRSAPEAVDGGVSVPAGANADAGATCHLHPRGLRSRDLTRRRGRRGPAARDRPGRGASSSVPPLGPAVGPAVGPTAVRRLVGRLLRLLLRPVRDHLRHQRQRRQHGPDPQQRHHRDRDGLEHGRREQGTQRDRAVEPLRRPRTRGDHVERRPPGAADHARPQRPDLPGDADGLVRVEVDVVGVQVDREVGVPDRVEAHPDRLLPGVGQHHLDGAPADGPGVRRLDAEHQVADAVDPQHHLGQGRRGCGSGGAGLHRDDERVVAGGGTDGRQQRQLDRDRGVRGHAGDRDRRGQPRTLEADRGEGDVLGLRRDVARVHPQDRGLARGRVRAGLGQDARGALRGALRCDGHVDPRSGRGRDGEVDRELLARADGLRDGGDQHGARRRGADLDDVVLGGADVLERVEPRRRRSSSWRPARPPCRTAPRGTAAPPAPPAPGRCPASPCRRSRRARRGPG